MHRCTFVDADEEFAIEFIFNFGIQNYFDNRGQATKVEQLHLGH